MWEGEQSRGGCGASESNLGPLPLKKSRTEKKIDFNNVGGVEPGLGASKGSTDFRVSAIGRGLLSWLVFGALA